ncbi:MAG TPA: DUF4422 domain-containing protein [Candidatus Limiplasma sp.]|nr:DUF4422 domain-containing protein [Candidatus Limiplasma sp.]
MKNIRILVATHKPYWMPADPMYLPLHVGRAGKPDLGFAGDDTGENISAKNSHYCELTGIYWAWKNLNADYIGIAHYRRHFATRSHFGNRRGRILTQARLESWLERCDVLVPKPRHYYVETNWSQYAHAHHEADLAATRAVLGELCPQALPAFDASMQKRGGHRFNMFIMRRDRFNDYCGWLFPILFALEQRLDLTGYSANDARVFGFVSERLLDVWLDTTRTPYREIPYVFTENQHWLSKGWRFLKRKWKA